MPSIQLDLSNIDAIIFDLGGVIINIDYERTIQKFSQISGFDASQLYTQRRQTQLFDQYETGQISSEQFRAGLRLLLNAPDVTDRALDDAWNAMLLDIPTQRIEWLQGMGCTNRIFLLSNTNAIHKDAFDQIFSATFGGSIPTLAGLFERSYFSHLMGDRKPNPSIFNTIIAEQGLIPSRTLFIDDSIQHIEGAQSVGLQTLHLAKGLSLEMVEWQNV